MRTRKIIVFCSTNLDISTDGPILFLVSSTKELMPWSILTWLRVKRSLMHNAGMAETVDVIEFLDQYNKTIKPFNHNWQDCKFWQDLDARFEILSEIVQNKFDFVNMIFTHHQICNNLAVLSLMTKRFCSLVPAGTFHVPSWPAFARTRALVWKNWLE